jgi:hypothetical protein
MTKINKKSKGFQVKEKMGIDPDDSISLEMIKKFSQDKKELKGFTIFKDETGLKFFPENFTNPWWRDESNRQEDGILCYQIVEDMKNIVMNLTEINKNGERKGKYKGFCTSIAPNPKSSQGSFKAKYQKALINELKKSKNELLKFKDEKTLLYVCIYLRLEKYEKYDLDNFLKAIVDSLKPFIGDDKNIVTLIAEKKILHGYHTADLDFLEQIFILITEPSAKADLLK